MEKWRNFIDCSGMDIWSVIGQSIELAHREHFDELRVRRDGFAELMFGPRLPKGSDSIRKADTFASGLSFEDGEDVENEPQRVKHEDEYEDQSEEEEGEDHREEEGKEIVLIDSDFEDDEPAGHHEVPHDPFDDDDDDDDDLEAFTDDKEKEKLLMNEIHSIKNAIDRLPTGSFLPEDEAMDILYRVQELNISVDALRDTKIGQSVSKYRKHPVKSVKAKAKEIVSGWKLLVDEYMRNSDNMPGVSDSAHDEAAPIGEEEVGLPTPPLDDGFVDAMEDVRELFNLSESDLSAASGPSPASDGPSVVDQTGRKSSSSPDQEQFARDAKSVARVVKVDKHRPVHMERTSDHYQRNATNSSGSIRKGPNAPSGVRSSTGMNSGTAPRATASGSAPPRQQSQGGVRKSDARPTPNVGVARPRVETTRPGLSTKLEPGFNDLNESKLEASKRKLNARYQDIENAKKQRTVRPLELTELPKGGPKAQRPGQPRGWVKPVR